MSKEASKELQAMNKIEKTLSEFDIDAQTRILAWFTDRNEDARGLVIAPTPIPNFAESN